MNKIGRRTLTCMAVMIVLAIVLALLPQGCEPAVIGAAFRFGGNR
jgi:hypothetical protein